MNPFSSLDASLLALFEVQENVKSMIPMYELCKTHAENVSPVICEVIEDYGSVVGFRYTYKGERFFLFFPSNDNYFCRFSSLREDTDIGLHDVREQFGL